MNKGEIIQQLKHHHQQFVDTIHAVPDEQFIVSVNGKWSAGQQLDHIRRSLKPLALGISMRLFILRILFGKANRPSRSYEALVEKYLHKLSMPYRIGKTFTPATVDLAQKEKLVKKVQWHVNVLCNRIDYFTEKELDNYILPHPLLGKLTIREMMYFTIYHVQHHHKQIVA